MGSNLLKNTLTNYLVVIVRVLQGVFVTRWTISYLGAENYGLWAVLWTIFAYSLLLDFGFGQTVQKYTGQGVYRTDIGRYNRIVSAVFLLHLAMGALILLISGGLSFFIRELFDVSDPEKIAYCRSAFLLFACGSALTFPTTIFPEIAVGLRKLYLRNYTNLVSRILELCGTFLVFQLGGGVRCLTVLVLGLTFGANVVVAFLALRQIPGFRFTAVIGWGIYREIGKFSGFVYMASIARLILNRSSRLIISFFLGLTAAGIFHMASRLSDFCGLAVSQYMENVRPVTARLHADGQTAELAAFILRSLKINLCVAVFFMFPAFIFAPEAVEFLFKVNRPEVFGLTRWFLVSMFLSATLRQTVHGYLMMSDHHRFLAITAMAEALILLPLNCLTIKPFGLVSILWNSIGMQLVISLGVLFPVALRALRLSWRRVIFRCYLPGVAAAVPGALVAWGFHSGWAGRLSQFGMLAVGGSLCSGLFAVLAYFLVLSPEERAGIVEKAAGLLQRFRHA